MCGFLSVFSVIRQKNADIITDGVPVSRFFNGAPHPIRRRISSDSVGDTTYN